MTEVVHLHQPDALGHTVALYISAQSQNLKHEIKTAHSEPTSLWTA